MSTELARTTGPSLPDQMQFAEALSASNLLPRAYQRQPANVLLAMQLGDALGIPPIQAINGIHVIDGKPTASADLIASLVRRAGHKLRVAEEQTPDGPVVTAQLIRRDDPDFMFEVVWDRAKAKAAGLAGKGNWSKHEGQMMRNRAITEIARQGASDALYGVAYTSEELGHEERTEVRQVEQPTAPAPKRPSGVAAAKAAITAPASPPSAPSIADVEGSDDIEHLRAMWRHATPEVRHLIEARVHDLEQAEHIDTTTGEVHDAEIVDGPSYADTTEES